MNSRRPILTLTIAATTLFASARGSSQQIAPKYKSSVTRAWATLRDGMAENDVKHRETAIAAIGTIGSDPQALRLVERGLQDKDPHVRQTAAATLGQAGDKEAIPYLKAALKDEPEVSFTAAKALWDLGDRSGQDIFEEVIEGQRKNVPGKLHGAFDQAKKKMNPGQLALMGAEDGTGAVFGPASLGIAAVEEAVKTVKNDTGAEGRRIAAEELATDPDPYALTLLEWALGDSNWGVRVAVAKALGERGNQGSIPKLAPLLEDDHHAVRYMAAASIVKLNLRNQVSSAD
jgi:HEAT repeat protein